MSAPSPLATPLPWGLVAEAYDAEIVPQFERYARDALAHLRLPAKARLLDVACGPGTLALLAAPACARVAALDFSREMISRLEQRRAALGLHQVVAAVGDGQALPYDDDDFDAAASMFGLIFFPDRHRGLTELGRVVRPGGRVVIGSWTPFDQVPAIAAVFAALAEALPGLPFAPGVAPLGTPADVTAELTAAGLRVVTVEPRAHTTSWPDASALWASLERTLAPLVLLRQRLGADAWAPIAARAEAALRTACGDGTVDVTMTALLGVAEA